MTDANGNNLLKTTVLQFGTSRFLQAHADLFFSQADPAVTVTTVQSSNDPSRAHRLKALALPEGFPVKVRGLSAGKMIDDEIRVTSVKQTLSSATNWSEVCEVALHADYIVSNTSDRGFDAQDADEAPQPSNIMSYPAKLMHILFNRFQARKEQPTLLPTELIPDNGTVLKERVLVIADRVVRRPDFMTWLAAMPSANSIVDRIVSEPIEPAGAVAEPYALWAIQSAPGITAPCQHPAIQMVDDLDVPERLKLHILNLGHTYMADLWARGGWDENMTVLDFMRSEHLARLQSIYDEEVLPVFERKGLADQARPYLEATLDRFANPFLAHRIADIAQNHPQKVERRIVAFYGWAGVAFAEAAPTLYALANARGS